MDRARQLHNTVRVVHAPLPALARDEMLAIEDASAPTSPQPQEVPLRMDRALTYQPDAGAVPGDHRLQLVAQPRVDWQAPPPPVQPQPWVPTTEGWTIALPPEQVETLQLSRPALVWTSDDQAMPSAAEDSASDMDATSGARYLD